MATITQVICDKCRSSSNVVPVDWEIGRETGQIDLCPKCLRHALSAVTVSSTKSPAKKDTSSLGEIRTWAKENGYDVPAKGRVPTEVVQAYQSRTNKAPALSGMVS